jgi:hypothetical protein
MRKTALSFPLGGALAALAAGSSGCLPSIGDLDSGPLNSTFAVSDVYTPSGYMGDGENFGKLIGHTNESCKPRPAGARGNCYMFEYFPNDIPHQDPWAGVYWVFPANNWGDTYGHAIDSSKFRQIRFFAAIEGPDTYTHNGATIPFNGLTGNINPFTNFTSRGGQDHADAVYGSVAATVDVGGTMMPTAVSPTITSQLKQFHISLDETLVGNPKAVNCWTQGAAFAPNCDTVTDANMKPVIDPNTGLPQQFANDLIGAFAWAVHYPDDQAQCSDPTKTPTSPCPTTSILNAQPVKIFIDDIVWDTEPAPTP